MQKHADLTTSISSCQKCPRLSGFLKELRIKYPEYHNKPVSAFGVENPKLLIVGLAPGMHGANASGRPFTGDFAGILLYQTLYKFGFADRPTASDPDDGLKLINCKITNAVKCLPPQNKPMSIEINTCNRYLSSEIKNLKPGAIILALGAIAHGATIKALKLKQKDYKFGHNQSYKLKNGLQLVDSYHCSRYNTQTKRLTRASFEAVFSNIVGKNVS